MVKYRESRICESGINKTTKKVHTREILKQGHYRLRRMLQPYRFCVIQFRFEFNAFYLAYTDVKRYGRTTQGGAAGASLRDLHNYLVTSPRVEGEWSDPV
jgi:hypothetical protein